MRRKLRGFLKNLESLSRTIWPKASRSLPVYAPNETQKWKQEKTQDDIWNFKSSICSFAAAAAQSLQSCLTLWDPIDGSPPGSPVPGILQARTLGWVAISFSSAWKWNVKVKSLSPVPMDLATPWTAAYQAPLSMGFSRQEYWGGLPLSSLNMFP